jgi:hypothetical protein
MNNSRTSRTALTVGLLVSVAAALLSGCAPSAPHPGLEGLESPAPTATSDSAELASLNGVFTVTLSPQEYRENGVTDEQLITENSGTWTLTLEDGDWSYTQEGEGVQRPADSGTYEIADGRVTWNWDGATVEFDYEQLPDGSLVFTEIDDHDPAYQDLSEVFFGLHPWVRVP